MNFTAIWIAALLLTGWQQAPPVEKPPQLFGFSARQAAEQLELERKLAAIPSPRQARLYHQDLTREPHVAGQPAQRRVAEYVLRHFEEAGIEAEIVEYRVYLPYPKRVSISMTGPATQAFALKEESVAADEYSSSGEVIAPFHAYSPSATAEGQVIYVNYGLPEDYVYLEEQGIDFQDRIVLARYGKSFRGVKVKVAEEHGAAGILIYSDPIDDGYFKGDIYPEGPMRPASAIQRGSVQYLFVHPGDPLTPGEPAKGGVRRLTPGEALNLPRIPSHPLSYGDAEKILRHLDGDNVPEGWQGALPFAYHVGPGPARVRMELEMDYAVRPIWNVVGRIKGSARPDEWVILGNHIDAWTFGAVDPNSGTTSLLELVRALGQLLKDGFSPRRTLVLAGWSAEEYGLIGSTEWGEDLRAELSEKAVAYINVDSAVSGPDFSASAVPSLQRLIFETAKSARDPASGETIFEAWLKRHNKKKKEPDAAPSVGPLGSGSDYTVFLDHLGIPSISMNFSGPYGVYHSLYDNHNWMDRFGDPEWQYHPAMAELWGRVALRLANAQILPFDFTTYGEAIQTYLSGLDLGPAETRETLHWDLLLEEAAAMTRLGSEIAVGIPSLLERSAVRRKIERINELLFQVERSFLLPEGLPGRPWFKHAIYAPGFYSGYASLPLPGLAQALKDNQPETARPQAESLLRVLQRANQSLDQVRRLLR